MKRLIFLFIGILVFILAQGLFFYKGWYFAPKFETPRFEQIVVPYHQPAEFADIITEKKTGKIVVDLAHNNHFSLSELNVLFSRVLARGFTIELVRDAAELRGALAEANALIITCPRKDFSKETAKAVKEFVTKGKKVLFIADPTRPSKINNVSLGFNLIFEPDYLYNLIENDANYRNIFITQFVKDNLITRDLEKVVLYTAGSISPADKGITPVDENTFSSLLQARKGLSPIALAKDNKVLAVYDLTFIAAPWNTAADNNRLISNIADWLTSN